MQNTRKMEKLRKLSDYMRLDEYARSVTGVILEHFDSQPEIDATMREFFKARKEIIEAEILRCFLEGYCELCNESDVDVMLAFMESDTAKRFKSIKIAVAKRVISDAENIFQKLAKGANPPS